ncbi:TPA: replication initiation protein [Vibrio parahaemolyticus]
MVTVNGERFKVIVLNNQNSFITLLKKHMIQNTLNALRAINLEDNKETELHFNINEIPLPHPYSGNIVKLRNEFVFAEYQMSLRELRLMYYIMSRFDVSEFFGKDGRPLNDQALSDIYKHSSDESRSIIIPVSELSDFVCFGSKSKSYEPVTRAVNALIKNPVILNYQDQEPKIVTPIQSAYLFKCKSSKLKSMLITFNWDFMCFVFGTSGYCKLNLTDVLKFKSPLALRYYHWIIHSIRGGKFGTIRIKIATLKDRLSIIDTEYQKHFYKRCIEKPLQEVIDVTNINVEIEKIFDDKKRGKPLQRIEIKINYRN